MSRKRPHSDRVATVAAEEFLSDLETRRYSPKTLAIYRQALSDFERFLPGKKIRRVQDVTPPVIEAYRRHL
jgi:site-specific recombinase XerD